MFLFSPSGKTLELKEGTGAQNFARKHPSVSRRVGPDGSPRATRRPGLRRGPMAAFGVRTSDWVAMGGASECSAEPGEGVRAHC